MGEVDPLADVQVARVRERQRGYLRRTWFSTRAAASGSGTSGASPTEMTQCLHGLQV